MKEKRVNDENNQINAYLRKTVWKLILHNVFGLYEVTITSSYLPRWRQILTTISVNEVNHYFDNSIH